MLLTLTEENYLKAIYTIENQNTPGEVSVNEIAERMSTKPATVTDMLRKLSEKRLIHYEKYKKMRLSELGMSLALQIVRKHRLWETFLHDKLQFTWDEVHEVAEQLEHIHSQKLIDRLDAHLGYPQYDPHGDPIPNAAGKMPAASAKALSELEIGEGFEIVAVGDDSRDFLQQLERLGLQIGTRLNVLERLSYDNSTLIQPEGREPFFLSDKIAGNILLRKSEAD